MNLHRFYTGLSALSGGLSLFISGAKALRLNHGVPTGVYEDFLTGFVVDNASVWGRPVGVTVLHDGTLLCCEDGNGTIWRVSYAK